MLSVDFKSNELEIGIVEEPTFTEKQIAALENPPSQRGVFKTLTVAEIEERLQAIAESG